MGQDCLRFAGAGSGVRGTSDGGVPSGGSPVSGLGRSGGAGRRWILKRRRGAAAQAFAVPILRQERGDSSVADGEAPLLPLLRQSTVL